MGILMVHALKMVLVAGASFYASAALAAPQYFMVGDLADPRCAYATIAEALQAAQLNGPELDYVMVANNAAYSGQAVRIGGQSVLIQGGYANCDLDVDQGQPFTELVGNNTDPVIQIEPLSVGNYDVRLSNLRIRGGGRNDVNGGGIRLRTATNATVTLSIENAEITGNRAQSGGGIHAERAGNPAGGYALTLKSGTRIHANTAASNGGGLNLWGGNTFIAAHDVSIDHNNALGAGGGIATIAGTFVYVGNPDLSPSRNDVSGAKISSNSAGTLGGGIYLSGTDTIMEAHELIVDGNTATFSGGGVAVAGGAQFQMLRDFSNAFGWYCPHALQCSRLSANQVGNGVDAGKRGGAIAVYGNSLVLLAQTQMFDNVAQDGAAIFADGAARLIIEGTTFNGNRATDLSNQAGALIRASYLLPSSPANIRIAYSTFIGNTRRDTTNTTRPIIDLVGQQGTALAVHNSAFLDSPYPWTMYSAHTSDCNVVRGGGLLDGNGTHTRITTTSLTDDKLFISPARRDWRPRFDSPLTDVCDSTQYAHDYRDQELLPRCRDNPRANVWGTCDAGALETDQLFANGVD